MPASTRNRARLRVDLTIAPGGVAADAFLEAYRTQSGEPLLDVPYWDIIAAVRALEYGREWVDSIQFVSPGLTGDILIERVAAFFDAAMESCP